MILMTGYLPRGSLYEGQDGVKVLNTAPYDVSFTIEVDVDAWRQVHPPSLELCDDEETTG